MSAARHELIETAAFLPPARALERLDAKDAERRLAGAPHSIAEIVSHMTHWQEWFALRIEGKGDPPVARAAEGWSAVSPGSWNELNRRFLCGLERVAKLGECEDDARRISPPLEFPIVAHYTVADAIHHVAQHNAHHLGQVVLMRQLMGEWPPPSGGSNW
jgi:uncharacterized damage-inducible protein DinB